MDEHMRDIHPVGEWRNSEPLDLRMPRSKPLLLYFWRSHTPESVETLHELNSLVRRHDNFPFDVIAVHAPEYDEIDDAWEDVLDHFNIELPVFHDPEFRTWETYEVQHAPSYVVIDEHGDEVLRKVGNLYESGMKEYIDDRS